jgi:hypothetical protein
MGYMSLRITSCLGVSVAGLSEPEYHRLTYKLTVAAAAKARQS